MISNPTIATDDGTIVKEGQVIRTSGLKLVSKGDASAETVDFTLDKGKIYEIRFYETGNTAAAKNLTIDSNGAGVYDRAYLNAGGVSNSANNTAWSIIWNRLGGCTKLRISCLDLTGTYYVNLSAVFSIS